MISLPLRVRLTLVFAAATALVLAGTGLLLYRHLETSLDRTLAQSLRARAADVTALIRQADTGLSQSAGSGDGFAQVLTPAGRIFDQSPSLNRSPLLNRIQLQRALDRPVLVPRAMLGGHAVRLLAIAVSAQGQRLVVIVGAPLTTRDGTLASLRAELLIGGPAALLLVSLIGYFVAAGALRPVERMRRYASEVSERDLAERLPVPRGGDELARLGRTLNEMLARIESGVKRERSFVADASHELRTPLALLRAEVDLALDEPRSQAELETALRSVGEEADRISQLAESLLLLARVDDGRLPLQNQSILVDDLLDGVAQRFDRRAREAGRRIETEGGGLRVDVDRMRLEQALGNLIDNALRHGLGTIRVCGACVGDDFELRVSDEGPGFPASFAARAFERFSRHDKARSSGGAGLGLAIVRAVAVAHGGSAEIGEGAEVVLRLPVPIVRPPGAAVTETPGTTSELSGARPTQS